MCTNDSKVSDSVNPTAVGQRRQPLQSCQSRNYRFAKAKLANRQAFLAPHTDPCAEISDPVRAKSSKSTTRQADIASETHHPRLPEAGANQTSTASRAGLSDDEALGEAIQKDRHGSPLERT